MIGSVAPCGSRLALPSFGASSRRDQGRLTASARGARRTESGSAPRPFHANGAARGNQRGAQGDAEAHAAAANGVTRRLGFLDWARGVNSKGCHVAVTGSVETTDRQFA